ncbi:MAG: hypothetical protein WA863_08010, partial [Methyloceanibacter sp.]
MSGLTVRDGHTSDFVSSFVIDPHCYETLIGGVVCTELGGNDVRLGYCSPDGREMLAPFILMDFSVAHEMKKVSHSSNLGPPQS